MLSLLSDLVCDTIVRGLLPKKFGGLESASVYVLVADNKLDFYNIVEIAHRKVQNEFRYCITIKQ